LVVTDATLIRVGVVASLPATSGVSLVGTARSATEGRRLADETSPDVIAVDAGLPDEDGLSFAAGLREAEPERGVVLIGPRDNVQLLRALEAGVSAYVPTNAPIEVLLSAIQHAAVAPASFAGPDLAQALAGRRRPHQVLSPREAEVLRLLRDGSTVARIAETMLVRESTVKTYLSRLYDKLGANNRAQALAAATRAGLV
jgi:DNA-binding NarL/FixJ family response regulator